MLVQKKVYFFLLADMVKFAKYDSNEQEIENSHGSVKEFILATAQITKEKKEDDFAAEVASLTK